MKTSFTICEVRRTAKVSDCHGKGVGFTDLSCYGKEVYGYAMGADVFKSEE